MEDTTLAHFNHDDCHKTLLIVDAGTEGVGAILAQEQPDKSLRKKNFNRNRKKLYPN